MDTLPIGVLVVAVIATAAVVIGVAFGIVVAPRLGRFFDRVDADDDEGPGDRAD